MYTAKDHTFVICAYKENPYIGATIESLKSQSTPGDIILSTSTPSSYLEDVCRQFSIRMVVNPHPHLAGDDWNYGYNAATTPLVTMAHQDDLYEPAYVERFIATLNQYDGLSPRPTLLFSDYYEIRNGMKVENNTILHIKRAMNGVFSVRHLNGSRWIKRRVLSFGCPICCPAVMLVKDALGPSPFDTTFKNSCDYKTWVDLASLEGRFVYIPEKLMGHRIYAESATSNNLRENIRKGEDLQILSSLWPKPVAKLVNALYSTSEKSNAL